MQRSLIFSFLCMCVLIGNVDARSRNQRPADFDEIETLVSQESNIMAADPIQADYYRRHSDEVRCMPHRKYFRMDNSSSRIKFYWCTFGAEFIQEAYINELDLEKAFIEGDRGRTINIPCLANRDCVWGSGTKKNHFDMVLETPSLANDIIQLLKPN